MATQDNWLSEFSSTLEARSLERDAKRKAFSEKLEEVGPAVFVPYEDGPEGHGVGWFRAEGGFVAFRKYSNGYEMLRCDSISDDMLLALCSKMPK